MNKLTYFFVLALFLAICPSSLIAASDTCQPKYFMTPKGDCLEKCGSIYKSGCSSGIRVCKMPCADGKSFDVATKNCVDSCPPLQWKLHDDIVSICSSETMGAVVTGKIVFDTTLESFNQNGGVDSFIAKVASVLDVSESQVRVTEIRKGSVIVIFEVLASGGATTPDVLTGLAQQLVTSIASGDFNVYGPVVDNILQAIPQYQSVSTCEGDKYLTENGDCVDTCDMFWKGTTYGGLKLCVRPCSPGYYLTDTDECVRDCQDKDQELQPRNVGGVWVCVRRRDERDLDWEEKERRRRERFEEERRRQMEEEEEEEEQEQEEEEEY